MTSRSIIIVEDDPLIQAFQVDTFKSFGYTILGVFNSGEALLESSLITKADLIIFDINLAGKLDGIETALKVQEVSRAGFIFVSALDDEETLRRATLTNARGYLIKPVEPNDLRAAVEMAFNRSPELFAKEVDEIHDENKATDKFDDESVIETLSSMEIFAKLPKASIADLCSTASIVSFDAGQFVVHDDSEDKGFILLSGRVSIVKHAANGKELTVSLLAPGDVFGMLFQFPEFSEGISARAQIPSKILRVPGKAFSVFGNKNPVVFERLCAVFANRLSKTYKVSSSIAHAKVETRILLMLESLLPSFGKGSGKGESRLYLTRKELAELVGTTPETSIRATKHLEREGLLDLTRPGIIKIKDVSELRRRCSEEQ